jgi:hypothetical protein
MHGTGAWTPLPQWSQVPDLTEAEQQVEARPKQGQCFRELIVGHTLFVSARSQCSNLNVVKRLHACASKQQPTRSPPQARKSGETVRWRFCPWNPAPFLPQEDGIRAQRPLETELYRQHRSIREPPKAKHRRLPQPGKRDQVHSV